MTRAGSSFDDEQQLLALPGSPPRWLWALTCRQPDCPCRSAIVLSAPGDRAAVLEGGRPVVEAWQQGADYFVVARDLPGSTVFAIDFDTGIAFELDEDEPMPRPLPPEVQELTDRLDDDVLDAIARLWHRGKGQPSPLRRPRPRSAATRPARAARARSTSCAAGYRDERTRRDDAHARCGCHRLSRRTHSRRAGLRG